MEEPVLGQYRHENGGHAPVSKGYSMTLGYFDHEIFMKLRHDPILLLKYSISHSGSRNDGKYWSGAGLCGNGFSRAGRERPPPKNLWTGTGRERSPFPKSGTGTGNWAGSFPKFGNGNRNQIPARDGNGNGKSRSRIREISGRERDSRTALVWSSH